MGQGYSITTLPAGSAGIDVSEMQDLSYEKSLGNARFMKCVRARRLQEGLVIVKVVMKPYPNFRLDRHISDIHGNVECLPNCERRHSIVVAQRKKLADIPNTLAYNSIIETSTCGYLTRQYINSSLYDRISTRPFLEDIERRWIAFQLLCAIRDCHARNVYHGDIKSENILVTSWNWLYLSDFSSTYKPTYLPDDNPADFSFFFDTSGRRTCYIAPERFYGPGEDVFSKSPINWAMDIFSVGCVIAELFLEAPIFTLSQLFKYRCNREYDPSKIHLGRIADKDIREMIAHMITLDPQDRYTAEDYLNFWKGKTFPEYFYSFMHQYMQLITDPSSGKTPLSTADVNLGEADDRIDRVYNDFDKISYFLGYESNIKLPKPSGWPQHASNPATTLQFDIFPAYHSHHAVTEKVKDDGTLLFLSIVVNSLKYTARATSRLKACDLLLAFAERLTDEAKLDRILPYLVSLLKDESEVVRAVALRSLTQLLLMVYVVSPTNAYIFVDYLLLRLQTLMAASENRQSCLIRMTYAMCLGPLASSAGRFLDMRQAFNQKGNVNLRLSLVAPDPDSHDGIMSRSTYHNMYDIAREDIATQFESHAKELLTDSDSTVRRAFLPSVSPLCIFLGKQRASDVILSHLNTYLNDQDWLLKLAFFQTIVGVATYIGTAGLEGFILPLMVQALTDPEEHVVEAVIRSFAALAQLGLFQRATTWELIDIVSRFSMHPNLWIRQAVARFISSTTTFLIDADPIIILAPRLNIYFRALPKDFELFSLLDAFKRPMPRIVLEIATTWAMSNGQTLFWKSIQKPNVFSFSFGDNIQMPLPKSATNLSLQRVSKSAEDESWIERIRSAGLGPEEDAKLLVLQEYIWRSAHRKPQGDSSREPHRLTKIVCLTDLHVMLQTIFCDIHNVPHEDLSNDLASEEQPRTIVEAMHDATSSTFTLPIQSNFPSSKLISGGKLLNSSPLEHASRSSTGQVDPIILESSLPDSVKPLRSTEVIDRGSSARSLLKLQESAKAIAEIGTNTTNAYGEVERASSHDKSSRKTILSVASPTDDKYPQVSHKVQIVHSYNGHDPNVIKLLDSLYLDNYPVELIAFGRVVAPIRGRPFQRAGAPTNAFGSWRPEGSLVAMLCEHTAGIRRVVAAPDHKFFITGSDDGTVKVWDTGRLERNINHRSRHTHSHGSKIRITSLCFVENTHCFISTGSDGSVHFVLVETSEQGQQPITKYGKIGPIRRCRLPEGEFAVWSQHQKADNQSILIVATNNCKVYGIELRNMKIVYTLHNPPHHGMPTCFCVDRKNQWLLLGTSMGVLALWDLRFKIRLRTWGFGDGIPIHRIYQPFLRGSKRSRVIICGGSPGEVLVFDVERVVIREVYKTSEVTVRETSLKSTSPVPTLVDLDDEQNRAGGFLSRFVKSSPLGSSPPGSDRSVRAVVMGYHSQSFDAKHGFLLTAGPDWKVRYWDSSRADLCTIVNGLEYDESHPTYTMQSCGDAVIFREIPDASKETEDVKADGNSSTPSKKGKASKNAIVSLQQQGLLRGHKGCIEDLALLEIPYGMVVSVDRAGVIYVFS